MKYFDLVLCIGLVATGCGGTTKASDTQRTKTTSAKSPDIEKLMRTKMNTSYSQLVFLVFHAEGDADYTKINEHTANLQDTVEKVMALTPPPVVASKEAREVYMTYNETLKRDAARFAAAVAQKDPDSMQSVLTRVGDTCNACHHFFRIEIEDAPTR
jgi:cytochrome c556